MDIDSLDLKELTKASNLVDAPNKYKKIDEEKLIELFKDITDKKIRNNYIFEAYNQGYSQYTI